MEAEMTQDDKTALKWTVGCLGVVAILFLIAYATGMMPAMTGC
jgi:hypothetical protein